MLYTRHCFEADSRSSSRKQHTPCDRRKEEGRRREEGRRGLVSSSAQSGERKREERRREREERNEEREMKYTRKGMKKKK